MIADEIVVSDGIVGLLLLVALILAIVWLVKHI